jgi:putative alpha-1,2-mannosidase
LSTDQACQNLQDEIHQGTKFDEVVSATKDAWNTEVLSKITTSSTNTDTLTLLYTSMYYMHLIPTNQTGENPGWKSAEPYYQDIFTFWVCSITAAVASTLIISGSFPMWHFSDAGSSARVL